MLRNGTPLASRVVHGVTDHLLSCIWNLAAVSGRCNWGVSAPSCCDFILRVTFEEVPRHREGEIGFFQNVAPPTRLPLEFQCETGLLLRVDGTVRILFQKAGESTLMLILGAVKGLR